MHSTMLTVLTLIFSFYNAFIEIFKCTYIRMAASIMSKYYEERIICNYVNLFVPFKESPGATYFFLTSTILLLLINKLLCP